jgi:hypothetical protein
MNTDIRVKTSFAHHHKTKKLKRKLGGDGVCALLFLWLFAAENRPDGVFSGMDPDDIAIAAQWDGDATVMLEAMLGVGFLCLNASGEYFIHDWIRNNAWAADAPARAEKASKAAKARWDKRNHVDAPVSILSASSIDSDAPSIKCDAPSNAPSPTPSPSLKTVVVEPARVVMAASEIQQLHVKYLGTIPSNQPVGSVLQDICRTYPPDRIRIAFEAGAAAERPSLAWIKTYLANPKNWNKELQYEHGTDCRTATPRRKTGIIAPNGPNTDWIGESSLGALVSI